MRFALVLVVGLACTPVQEIPQRDDLLAAWHRHTREALSVLFPEHAEKLEDTHVEIIDWPEPNAFGMRGNLVVTTGLIDLMRGEGEYAAVLAHEFGHLLMNHKSTRVRGLFGLPGEDIVLLEKQETEADAFAVLVLRRAGLPPCAAATAIGRTLDVNGARRTPENVFAALGLRREAALVAGCAEPKMPPTASGQFYGAFWRVYLDILIKDIWPGGSPFTDIIVVAEEDYLAFYEYLTGKLYIGPEMLRQTRDRDELAFVLAHEASHGILNHVRQYRTMNDFIERDFKAMERRELAADKYAFSLLKSRGLDACAGLRLEVRLTALYSHDVDPKLLPTDLARKRVRALNRIASKRVAALQKRCKAQ